MKDKFLYVNLEKISSTQDYAIKIAQTIENDFCVSAKIQTAGYGRRGTKWFSPYGGLYLTLCLNREIKDNEISTLSIKAAYAVKEYLKSKAVECQIKYPNDIVVEFKGKKRKICGILCQTSPQKKFRKVFVGVGLNLNNKVPLSCQAVSVFEILKRKIDEKSAEREIISLIRKAI